MSVFEQPLFPTTQPISRVSTPMPNNDDITKDEKIRRYEIENLKLRLEIERLKKYQTPLKKEEIDVLGLRRENRKLKQDNVILRHANTRLNTSNQRLRSENRILRASICILNSDEEKDEAGVEMKDGVNDAISKYNDVSCDKQHDGVVNSEK